MYGVRRADGGLWSVDYQRATTDSAQGSPGLMVQEPASSTPTGRNTFCIGFIAAQDSSLVAQAL